MNTIQTPQKYVPRLHLKSQLRLRPSVKFQMHILAPSDKRLPMHALYVLQTLMRLCNADFAVLLRSISHL